MTLYIRLDISHSPRFPPGFDMLKTKFIAAFALRDCFMQKRHSHVRRWWNRGTSFLRSFRAASDEPRRPTYRRARSIIVCGCFISLSLPGWVVSVRRTCVRSASAIKRRRECERIRNSERKCSNKSERVHPHRTLIAKLLSLRAARLVRSDDDSFAAYPPRIATAYSFRQFE